MHLEASNRGFDRTRLPALDEAMSRKPKAAMAEAADDTDLGGSLDAVLERIRDGVVALDTNWRYTYVNRAAGEMLSRRPEDLVGKHIWTEFPEGLGQPFHLACERAFREQAVTAIEAYYAPWDKWFENRIYPSPEGVTIYFQDVTERVRQREQLRASVERYRSIFEHASDGIFISDSNWRYTDVNPRAEELTGYSREELLGMNVRDLMFQEDLDADPPQFDLIGAAEPYIRIRRIRRKDGSVISLESSVQRLRDGSLFAVARDVSARESTATALRASEERFRRLVENSWDLILMIEPSGLIAYSSDSSQRILGRKASEIVGTMCFDYVHPEDLPLTQAELAKALEAPNATVSLEFRAIHADGSTRYLEGFGINLLDDPTVGAIVGNVRDITERKQMEDSLRRGEALFRATVSSAPLGILLDDGKGNCLYVNDVQARLMGMEPWEALGEGWMRAIHPEDLERGREAFAKAMSSGAVFKDDCRYVHRDGSTVWVSLQIVPVIDREEVLGYVGVSVDITDRIRHASEIEALNLDLERKVAERTAQLKVTNEQLESFTYSVSHDLRTPLRTVALNAALLKADHGVALPPEVSELVERITSGAERMGHLIDDMLALSRVGRRMLKLERLDMAALARMTAETMVGKPKKTRFLFGEMPSPMADARLVGQLLENLISNAVKFSSKTRDPVVEVGFDRDRGAYFVRDNGAGFDMNHAQRLFEPFERFHPEAEFGGTGIGLAIVKRIAEVHGGRVFAESTPGSGSCFWFTLGS